MTNKDGISVDEVRAESVVWMLEHLRDDAAEIEAHWDRDIAERISKAADLIEARERAYLALSEAAFELTQLANRAEYPATYDRLLALCEPGRAALSHKGMDHG